MRKSEFTLRFGFLAVFAVIWLLLPAADSLADLPKQLTFEPIEFHVPETDTMAFPNGLHGYLMEDHDVPVINVVLMYRTGYPTEDKMGLADIAGWAIRNGGSLKYTKEAIDDQLEFIGASVESYSGNNIGQMVANFLTKDTDMVLDIFADLLINPAFDPDKIELRKKSQVEAIRRKADDPRDLGRSEFAKIVYRDHPAGWEPTTESVSNIAREDVIEFHSRYVRPNNAVIAISGDITVEGAHAKIDGLLAGWEPGGVEPSFPEMKYQLVPSVNYIYKDVNQAYIFAGHMGMNSANEDRAYADLMNYILGGGSFTSWITKRIRSDEGLAYSARSYFGDSPWGYGLFIGSCQTKTDAAMRALGLLIEQIERMKTVGPTEQELLDAKESFINSHVFDYESAARIVNRLAWYDITGLPLDSLEREFRSYQSATVDDIRRVAREYLHPDSLTILVVGDQALFDRPLSDFGEVNTIVVEQQQEVQAP
jgi:zinc protease